MKIIYVSKWVIPWGYGITLTPNLILIRKDSIDKIYVREHELIHVEQMKRLGYFRFLYEYFKELIKVGYMNNKFEIQARELGTKRRNELMAQFEAACCGDTDVKL